MEHSSSDFADVIVPNVGEGLTRQESTGYWERAYAHALRAGRMLREAHHMRVTDPYHADEMARSGIDCLQQSALLIPHEELDRSLLDNWGDREEAVLRV